MAICSSCGSYYRLSAHHKDRSNCEDCSCVLPRSTHLDEESELEIHNLLHPDGKTAVVRYDDDDTMNS